MTRSRLSVLADVVRDPSLARIEIAFFSFNMTEYGTWIAILVYAFERAGPRGAGVAAVVQLIPAAVVAPFAAFIGDRFRRDRALLAGYVAQAASLAMTACVLALDAPLAIVYVSGAFASVSLTFTRPAQAALLPSIATSPEELSAANAVSSLAENVGIFAGPLLAGVLLAVSGPATVFGLFAAITSISVVLVASLPRRGDDEEPSGAISATSVVQEAFGGFRVLGNDADTRLLVAVPSVMNVLVGALDVLVVAIAIDLIGGRGWAGVLNAAFGLGGVVAVWFTVSFVGRTRLAPPLVEGTTTFGGAIAAIGAIPVAGAMLALTALAGTGRAVASVASTTLLQRSTSDHVLARVFGVVEGLTMVGLAVGSMLASFLVARFGVRSAVVLSGLPIAVIIAILYRSIAALDRRSAPPDPTILRIVRALPLFAPLPAPAMASVMANVQVADIARGEVVIREGDAGDRFYVLIEGDVDVFQRGEFLGARHSGEMLGEIALIHDVPRTATVVAATPLTVAYLERDHFLNAVAGFSLSRALVEEAAEAHLKNEGLS